MKVTNPLEDFTGVDEGNKVTAGGSLRALATEAGPENLINTDAAATTKQDQVGGGGENGLVDQKKLSRREALSDCNKADDPPGLLARPLSSTRVYSRRMV